jgi:hypothetical protein
VSRAGRVLRAAGLVLLAVVLVAVMVRLSLWQEDKARATGSLLNWTYAVEWLLFAGLTVAGLVRLAREGVRHVGPADGAAEARPPVRPGGPVVGPPLAPGQELEEITWVRVARKVGLGPSR